MTDPDPDLKTGEPDAAPAAKAPRKAPKPKVLATVSPYVTFDAGVEGVGPVTNGGTPVPAELATAVHDAAAAAHVELKEI